MQIISQRIIGGFDCNRIIKNPAILHEPPAKKFKDIKFKNYKYMRN